jgi:hypothetical protein
VSARKGFCKVKSSKENAKIFKELSQNLNDPSGGLSSIAQTVRMGHQKSNRITETNNNIPQIKRQKQVGY